LELHLTYALALTPFEASLTTLDWNEVAAQDYPLHVLYCHETNLIVYQSYSQKNNPCEEILAIEKILANCSITALIAHKVLVVKENEKEVGALLSSQYFQ
jgi:hypothetical protein